MRGRSRNVEEREKGETEKRGVGGSAEGNFVL